MDPLLIIALVFGLPLLGHAWYWWWARRHPVCPACGRDTFLDRGTIGGDAFAIVGDGAPRVAACPQGHVYRDGVLLAQVLLKNRAQLVRASMVTMTIPEPFTSISDGRLCYSYDMGERRGN